MLTDDNFATPSNHTLKRMENMVTGVGSRRYERRPMNPEPERWDHIAVVVRIEPTNTFWVVMADSPEFQENLGRFFALPSEFYDTQMHVGRCVFVSTIMHEYGEEIEKVTVLRKDIYYCHQFEFIEGFLVLGLEIITDELKLGDQDDLLNVHYYDSIVGLIRFPRGFEKRLHEEKLRRFFMKAVFAELPRPYSNTYFLGVQWARDRRSDLITFPLPSAVKIISTEYHTALDRYAQRRANMSGVGTSELTSEPPATPYSLTSSSRPSPGLKRPTPNARFFGSTSVSGLNVPPRPILSSTGSYPGGGGSSIHNITAEAPSTSHNTTIGTFTTIIKNGSKAIENTESAFGVSSLADPEEYHLDEAKFNSTTHTRFDARSMVDTLSQLGKLDFGMGDEDDSPVEDETTALDDSQATLRDVEAHAEEPNDVFAEEEEEDGVSSVDTPSSAYEPVHTDIPKFVPWDTPGNVDFNQKFEPHFFGNIGVDVPGVVVKANTFGVMVWTQYGPFNYHFNTETGAWLRCIVCFDTGRVITAHAIRAPMQTRMVKDQNDVETLLFYGPIDIIPSREFWNEYLGPEVKREEVLSGANRRKAMAEFFIDLENGGLGGSGLYKKRTEPLMDYTLSVVTAYDNTLNSDYFLETAQTETRIEYELESKNYFDEDEQPHF